MNCSDVTVLPYLNTMPKTFNMMLHPSHITDAEQWKASPNACHKCGENCTYSDVNVFGLT